MWFHCLAPFGLTALLQTFILGAQLDDWDDVPGFVFEWTLFLPTIIYLGLAVPFVLTRFYSAVHFATKATTASTATALAADTTDATALYQAHQIPIWRRRAIVTLVDTVFDTALLAAAITFVAMLSHTMAVAQDGSGPYSFMRTSIPLVVIWSLLTFVALLAANRTYVGKARASATDDVEPAYRSNAVKEKQVYFATANYQEWPTAFMFTWSLGYGWPDSVLAVLLFAMLPAMIVVTLMFAHFLDTGTPSIAEIFIILWILEGLILIFTVLAAVWMCCCAWLPNMAPTGRLGRAAKTAELFAIAVGTILLVVQQILLTVRVDEADPIDWNVVFIPLYVFFALVTLMGCMFGFCCIGPRSGSPSLSTHPCANHYDADDSSTLPHTSAWGLIE